MSSLNRYSRQIVLPEVGVSGQTILCDSSVLIVGLGGLGSPAAFYLAAAGIGRLILADHDRVSLSNLQRQILYNQADVGQEKIVAASAKLKAIQRDIEIDLLPTGTDQPQFDRAVANADIVLDCTDNFASRYAINAACIAHKKLLVSGAAIRMEGQIAAFDHRHHGACYACLYPETDGEAESCEDSGILGPVVGVIGAMQALMALHLLLGHTDISSQLHCWNARNLSWRKLSITKDANCTYCN